VSEALQGIEPLFRADEIERAVLDLGARLYRELGDDDPLFLGLLGGSVVFLADLVRAYEAPVRFELVHVAYHQPEIAASELLAIQYPIPVDMVDQDLLVVKDVVKSGVTETYLAEQLRQKGARRVRFVTLIDMPDERKTELEIDHHLFSVRENAPLVGYGLKHQGRYGNLPYVGRLTGEGPTG